MINFFRVLSNRFFSWVLSPLFLICRYFLWKNVILLFFVKTDVLCHSLYHAFSLVVIHCTTRCHSSSLVVIRWTTRCHSLSLVVIRCTTRCYSLSLVVIRYTTRCHSSSLVVVCCATSCYLLSLAVIRCHSMYQSSVFSLTIMKFGQLIEDNTKNTYLEKSYRKCGVETSLWRFFEKVKFCIFLDQNSKFWYSWFIYYIS